MSWKNVQYQNGKYRTSEGGGGGGSSTFGGLDDVSFSDLQNGQVPKYNSTTQQWENANESGGGGTVTDVEVDGVSVVNQQGVAEIPAIPDGLHHYSTTEQVVGTWINGKPIYEKTISPLTTTAYSYALDVSALHINEIIDFHLFIHNTTGGDYAFGSYWEGNTDKLNWYLHSSKNTIYIRSNQSYSYGTGWCVIQYTKTTD